MSIKRLSPMRAALSAGEVRSHLRNFNSEESDLITSYLLASQQDIEIQCERSIVMAKFRLTLPRFPWGTSSEVRALPFDTDAFRHETDGSAVCLNMVPTAKVETITYYDQSNELQSYEDWNLFADSEPGELRQAIDTSWPTTYQRRDAVTITFWAGQIIPLGVDLAADQFISVSGYSFVNGDEITISKSGNNNSEIGDVATLPDGVEASTTYFVRDVSGSRFKIAATSGGTALSLAEPATDGAAIDLLFAGEIDPFHRLALLQMTAKAYGERCPEGGCVCSASDFESNPMLRRLQWRPPVQFMG
jgi:hypothetical protein